MSYIRNIWQISVLYRLHKYTRMVFNSDFSLIILGSKFHLQPHQYITLAFGASSNALRRHRDHVIDRKSPGRATSTTSSRFEKIEKKITENQLIPREKNWIDNELAAYVDSKRNSWRLNMGKSKLKIPTRWLNPVSINVVKYRDSMKLSFDHIDSSCKHLCSNHSVDTVHYQLYIHVIGESACFR